MPKEDRPTHTGESGSPPVSSGLRERLEPVLQFCRNLHDQQNPHNVLSLIVKEAATLFEADRASLFLLDREQGELVSQVTLDGKQIRFDARLGIAGASAMTKQLINVSNAQEDARFHAAVDAQTKYRTRTVLAVPLLDANAVCIGVLQALNKRKGSFTGVDEDIGKILATQAAIALSTMMEDRGKQRQQEPPAPHASGFKEAPRGATTQDIIGTSSRMQDIVRLIDRIGETAVDVLITGESGTGKEMVARAIHSTSPRAAGPFVAINCGALPENLIESELFGIEKGVATGVERRIGKFEEAHGGTIFLDEIGDLSQGAQVKLLRVLQERVVERVGGRTVIPTDVRVIAATNADLSRAIERGAFRADLYYRLKVVTIQMPPLREIPEDVPVLARSFLQKYARMFSKEPKQLADDALDTLLGYGWPGNVRELENEMKRLVASMRKPVIGAEDLSETILEESKSHRLSSGPASGLIKEAVEQLERRMIREALVQSKQNQVRAAKALGLSRQGLLKKMKRYGIMVVCSVCLVDLVYLVL
jgi:Nif-specific regulatory protein